VCFFFGKAFAAGNLGDAKVTFIPIYVGDSDRDRDVLTRGCCGTGTDFLDTAQMMHQLESDPISHDFLLLTVDFATGKYRYSTFYPGWVGQTHNNPGCQDNL
jgi:hypothetical protein